MWWYVYRVDCPSCCIFASGSCCCCPADAVTCPFFYLSSVRHIFCGCVGATTVLAFPTGGDDNRVLSGTPQLVCGRGAISSRDESRQSCPKSFPPPSHAAMNALDKSCTCDRYALTLPGDDDSFLPYFDWLRSRNSNHPLTRMAVSSSTRMRCSIISRWVKMPFLAFCPPTDAPLVCGLCTDWSNHGTVRKTQIVLVIIDVGLLL